MKLLVYGAGVTGSLFSARLHEAGHDVSLLARGERLAALRAAHGVQLAEGDSPGRQAGTPVPVVEHRSSRPGHDLTAVLVRTHQVNTVLESIQPGLEEGDVLFLLNLGGRAPEPLGAVIGRERVLLSFPTAACGTMDGDDGPLPPDQLH